MGQTGSIERDIKVDLSKFIGKQEVVISRSMLSELPPNFLRYVSSCTDLNLSYNSFSTIPPELQQLNLLYSLNLSGNVIKNFESLVNIPSLKELKLNACFLNKVPEIPKSITKLALKENPLQTKISLKNLPNLEEIDLSSCSIKKIVFDKENKFEILKLNGTQIESLKFLANVPNLKYLSLNRVTILKHSKAILNLQKLEKLDCGYISRISPKDLQNLITLKCLKFTLNKRFCENILNDCIFKYLEILKINDSKLVHQSEIFMIGNLSNENINIQDLFPNLDEKQYLSLQIEFSMSTAIHLSTFPNLKELEINVGVFICLSKNLANDNWNISVRRTQNLINFGPFKIKEYFQYIDIPAEIIPFYGKFGQVYIIPKILVLCCDKILSDIQSFVVYREHVVIRDLENKVHTITRKHDKIEKISNVISFYYFYSYFFMLTDHGTLYYYNYLLNYGPVLCENLPFVTNFFVISEKIVFLQCEDNEIWELQLVIGELQNLPLSINPRRCFKVNYFEMIKNISKMFSVTVGKYDDGNYIWYKLIFIIDNNEKLWCCNFQDKMNKDKKNIAFLNYCDVFSQYEITYIKEGEKNIYFYYKYGIFYVKKTELCPSDKPTKINLVFNNNHDYFVNKKISQKSARK